MELFKIRNPLQYSLTRKSGVKNKLFTPVVRKQNTALYPVSGFIPVHMADVPQPSSGDEKIEIRFPDGIQVVLSGPSSLSMAESLICRR